MNNNNSNKKGRDTDRNQWRFNKLRIKSEKGQRNEIGNWYVKIAKIKMNGAEKEYLRINFFL